ncbi:Uncharacterised protein [Vibrio cholerae]|nr:Uncharacterised protein [Vibrio cholerae]
MVVVRKSWASLFHVWIPLLKTKQSVLCCKLSMLTATMW